MENLDIDGFGYVYILSNPSVSGLKVGYTNNSVNQRIEQLSSVTGVPTAFIPEAVYMSSSRYLYPIEQLAHKKLKENGFHIAKEFFNIEIERCINFVETSFKEITNSEPTNLIKQHNEKVQALKQEFEAKRIQDECREISKNLSLQQKEQRLKWINLNIGILRDNYIREQSHLRISPLKKLTSMFAIPGIKTDMDIYKQIKFEAKVKFPDWNLSNIEKCNLHFPELVKAIYFE